MIMDIGVESSAEAGDGGNRTLIRGIVVALAAFQAAVFGLLVLLALMEDSNLAILGSVAKLAAAPFFAGTLPALILALANRGLPLALGLVVGVMLAAAYAWPRL